MKIKPRTWLLLKEMLVIYIWWYITSRIFFVFKYSSLALVANPEEEKELFWVMVNLNTYIALIAGTLSILIELVISPKLFNFNHYWKKILAKTFLYIIFSLILGSFAFFYMRSMKFSVVNIIFNPERNLSIALNFLTFAVYILLSIVTLNIARDLKSALGNKIIRARILGKYYRPKEEERIFMFLDLESSTSIAEQLGHIKYSRFIQDCFKDLNNSIINYKARVYQYVGDEVILTWNLKQKKNVRNSIELFFDYIKYLKSREDYYLKNYGIIPMFRAAINSGKVTVAEVGEVKKEISYHGDVLNTAARVQKLCKPYNQLILVTERFAKLLDDSEDYVLGFVDEFILHGKEKNSKVYYIHKK